VDSPLFRVRDALAGGPRSRAELVQITGLDEGTLALALAHWRQRGRVRRAFALGTSNTLESSRSSACARCRGCAAGTAPSHGGSERFVWIDRG